HEEPQPEGGRAARYRNGRATSSGYPGEACPLERPEDEHRFANRDIRQTVDCRAHSDATKGMRAGHKGLLCCAQTGHDHAHARVGGSMKPGVIGNLQLLRGIAAIGVVFYHTDYRLAGNVHTDLRGVETFFVISGFIMCYISQNDPKWFFWKRVLRIV